MKILSSIVITITCCFVLWPSHQALAEEIADNCRDGASSVQEIVACEEQRANAREAKQRSLDAVATRYGSWLKKVLATDGTTLFEAMANSDKRPALALSLRCSESAGFEIWITALKGLYAGSLEHATLLVDQHPPAQVDYVQIMEGAFVKIRNVGQLETAILGAKRIGVRLQTDLGDVQTFYFDFTDLAAGKNVILGACPA